MSFCLLSAWVINELIGFVADSYGT